MNYLDELLARYPDRDTAVKKFTLGRLLDASPGQATDELVELLWSEAGQPELALRHEAHYLLGRVLPRHTAAAYSLVPATASPETTLVEGELRTQPEIARIVTSAGVLLEPLLERVIGHALRGASRVRSSASMILGQLATPRIVEMVAGSVVSGAAVHFGLACALAESGQPQAHQALCEIVRTESARNPDLLMLLRSTPDRAALRCLEECEKTASTHGLMNIAHALGGFAPDACRPMAERLIAAGGWPATYALDAVATWGDARCLASVIAACEGDQSKLIQVQAVRAAGAMGTGPALEFCRARLASPDASVQAAVLDALVPHVHDLAWLKEALISLCASEHVRIRVRAVTMLALVDPERSLPALRRMITSESTAERRGAAHVLGHIEGPKIDLLLERIAGNDPVFGVRAQAMRSLVNLGSLRGAPPLLHLLETSDDPAELAEVARAIASFPNEEAAAVLETFPGDHSGFPPPARALLMRCAGTLAGAAGQAAPGYLLAALADPDPTVCRGALEGARCLGDLAPSDAVRALLGHADLRVRARAAGVLVAAGDLNGVDALAPMLGHEDEPVRLAALDMLLELANVLPHAVRTRRFEKLCEALSRKPVAPAPLPERELARPRQARSYDEQVAQSLLRARRIAPAVKEFEALAASYQHVAPDRRPRKGAGAPVASAEGPLAAFRRSPLMMLWAAFALLGVVGVIGVSAFRGPRTSTESVVAPGPAGLSPGTFGVTEVKGVCTRTAPGSAARVLRVGDIVAAGDLVEVSPNAKLTLTDSPGNALRFDPGSQLLFTSASALSWSPKEMRYAFENPGGDIQLDFRRAWETKLRLGTAMFTLTRGTVKVADDGPGRKLTQESGEGTLFTPTGTFVRLAPGKSASVANAPR